MSKKGKMNKLKKQLAKLAYKYLEQEIINIMSDEGYKQTLGEAERQGYTEDTMNEYYSDMQDRKMRPVYDAGYDDGYADAVKHSS